MPATGTQARHAGGPPNDLQRPSDAVLRPSLLRRGCADRHTVRRNRRGSHRVGDAGGPLPCRTQLQLLRQSPRHMATLGPRRAMPRLQTANGICPDPRESAAPPPDVRSARRRRVALRNCDRLPRSRLRDRANIGAGVCKGIHPDAVRHRVSLGRGRHISSPHRDRSNMVYSSDGAVCSCPGRGEGLRCHGRLDAGHDRYPALTAHDRDCAQVRLCIEKSAKSLRLCQSR